MQFEGVTLSDADVIVVLKDAAHGSVPVHDIEAAQNPGAWALALVHTLAGSPLRRALASAIATLLQSGDAEEVRLGIEAFRAQPIVDADVLWETLVEHTAAGRFAAAAEVSTALLRLAHDRHLSLDERLRDLIVKPSLSRELFDRLLNLAGALDADWLAQQPDLFQGDTDDDTTLRVAEAGTAMGSAALATFVDALDARCATFGRTLPASTRKTLAAMIAARQKAGM